MNFGSGTLSGMPLLRAWCDGLRQGPCAPSPRQANAFRNSPEKSFQSGTRRIRKDNSGIKNFRAELDGQWLMFTNDKAAAWIYNFDKRCPYGVHRLKVRIDDIVGNVTAREWWFKRDPYSPPKKTASKKKTSGKKHAPGSKRQSTNKKK